MNDANFFFEAYLVKRLYHQSRSEFSQVSSLAHGSTATAEFIGGSRKLFGVIVDLLLELKKLGGSIILLHTPSRHTGSRSNENVRSGDFFAKVADHGTQVKVKVRVDAGRLLGRHEGHGLLLETNQQEEGKQSGDFLHGCVVEIHFC